MLIEALPSDGEPATDMVTEAIKLGGVEIGVDDN